LRHAGRRRAPTEGRAMPWWIHVHCVSRVPMVKWRRQQRPATRSRRHLQLGHIGTPGAPVLPGERGEAKSLEPLLYSCSGPGWSYSGLPIALRRGNVAIRTRGAVRLFTIVPGSGGAAEHALHTPPCVTIWFPNRALRVVIAGVDVFAARTIRRGAAGDARRVVGVRLHLRELLGRSGLQQRSLLGALGALAFRAHLLGGEGGGEEGQNQDSGASHVDLGLDRGAGLSLANCLPSA